MQNAMADRKNNNHRKNNNKKQKPKQSKTQGLREEIEELTQRKTQLPELTEDDIVTFEKLPLSIKTLKGLKRAGFTVPTKIQRQSLLFSLAECDVVGAAKTGSGKTLAFIIPILEKLYCSMWTKWDGLGAVVITPTRELAYQIFEVLNKVGKEHDFSAGLVIGGTDLVFEWQRVKNCNIMISTPGRLLQHMTENPDFLIENVQVLVLDEADMCLSMGFSESVNCILEELPPHRQTLLFSATQTRDVKDLIRAGCKNPVFCSVHEHSKTSTPKSLVESYIVCESHEKLNFLWSFIRYHKKQKLLVFLSTCKQVKYVYTLFCKLQPGVSVMALHGNMKQLKRMAIYDQFCRKQTAVLFATDVAARGLDIPAVHWVVQADCPEDVTTYIHRAGRTARYSKAGEALLVLTPSEEPEMIANLKAKNIPVQQIFLDVNKQQSMNVKMGIMLSKYNSLKEDAVRAYKSYIKHIAQMKDKNVFNVLSIDLDAFARSLGLVVTPRVRFLEKLLKQKLGDGYKRKKHEDSVLTTLDFGTNDSDEDDDEFLTSSKTPYIIPDMYNLDPSIHLSNKKKKKILTKEEVAKKLLKKKIQVNQRSMYDDEGNLIIDPNRVQQKIEGDKDFGKPSQGINIEEIRNLIKEGDRIDKEFQSARRKEMKREKKRKEQELKKQSAEEGANESEDESEDSDADELTKNIIEALPDPHKIYDTENENDGTHSEVGNESDDSSNAGGEGGSDKDLHSKRRDNRRDNSSSNNEPEEAPRISGKRKARLIAREVKRAKMVESNNLSALPLEEQEQLALYLLRGKN
ncbi:ATPdependent RNA helicase [Halocaridina rubra]|uniref:ATP-dependent RNA helicase n=1 Tax=Halocaridina rubra TaxID=373956 RepID=A0AAN8WQ23_HALRR